MRAVLDTDVLVSAFISQTGYAYRVYIGVVSRVARLLYDERILAEYSLVATYPKLAGHLRQNELLEAVEYLRHIGEFVDTTGVVLPCAIPDNKDIPFAEVALAGGADAIVTRNRRHFPPGCGVTVLSPFELCSALGLA